MPLASGEFGKGGGLKRGEPIEPKRVRRIHAHGALEGEKGCCLRETRLNAPEEGGWDLHSLCNDVYTDGAGVGEEHTRHSVLHQRGNVEGVEELKERLGLGLSENPTPHNRVFIISSRRGRSWITGGSSAIGG